ncbi:MAG: hypothetical protein AAGJ18_01480 [Bacteroidota bacterium]
MKCSLFSDLFSRITQQRTEKLITKKDIEDEEHCVRLTTYLLHYYHDLTIDFPFHDEGLIIDLGRSDELLLIGPFLK